MAEKDLEAKQHPDAAENSNDYKVRAQIGSVDDLPTLAALVEKSLDKRVRLADLPRPAEEEPRKSLDPRPRVSTQMEFQFPESKPRRRGKRKETRQELMQRLLNPELTVREAAILLNVCPATIRRYTNCGALRCHRTPGRQRRFYLSDVLAFIKQYGR